MHLASPIWLIGLIPWAAVAVWLLSGSRQRVRVPFLVLWQGPVDGPRTRRKLHAPPVSIALAMLALLLAIVAAAHPQIPRARNAVRGALTIILDRGITMSARGAKDFRYREAVDDAWHHLREHFADCTVRLVSVPGHGAEQLDLDQFIARVRQLPPTALDTRQMLSAAEAQAKPPVLLISDQLVLSSGPVIQAAPQSRVRDISIIALAARERPAPQVMVRVRNQSPQASTVLRVMSAGRRIEDRIDLPPEPGERNFFIDLPQIGNTVSAELLVQDDLPADDRAWLVREGMSAKIEPRFPLAPELRRLIDAYQRTRPFSDRSVRLSIVRQVSDVPEETPAVIIAAARGSVGPLQVQAADHPVTRYVNWRKIPAAIRASGNPPAGWVPLVRDGNEILVAVKPTTPNQVWIGFDSAQWTTSTDYVIFWTNVFDWAGGGGESLQGHVVNDLSPEWKAIEENVPDQWPGLYRRADGAVRAFNPPDVPPPPPRPATDWRERIAALAVETSRVDSAPWLLICALACLLASAALWKRAMAQLSPSPAGPPAQGSPRR